MRVYGLIGKSLNHSFSANYFKEKFAAEKIKNSVYLNFEFEKSTEIRKSLSALKGLSGLNVTVPYKIDIMEALDGVGDKALKIGAVNTIAIQSDGRWKGFNTDVYGFLMSLKPFLTSAHERALILGSGGASRAVDYGLKKRGLATQIVSRHPKGDQIGYSVLNKNMLSHYKLIVNTTPLGTWPNTQACPSLPFDGITPQHLVYDLIYNPEKTEFLWRAEAQGAQIMNGRDMLRHQAEKSWEIWQNSE